MGTAVARESSTSRESSPKTSTELPADRSKFEWRPRHRTAQGAETNLWISSDGDTAVISKLKSGAETHRKQNEDSVVYTTRIVNGFVEKVICVADGMGGKGAHDVNLGHIASANAVDHSSQRIGRDGATPLEAVAELQGVHDRYCRSHNLHPESKGTTIFCAVAGESSLNTAHCGDSGGWLINRQTGPVWISRLHSNAQIVADMQVHMSEDESPSLGKLTPPNNYIGVSSKGEPRSNPAENDGYYFDAAGKRIVHTTAEAYDRKNIPYKPGDIFITWSDGAYAFTTPKEAFEIVTKFKTPAAIAQEFHRLAALRSTANNNDNFTCVVTQLGGPTSTERAAVDLPVVARTKEQLFAETASYLKAVIADPADTSRELNVDITASTARRATILHDHLTHIRETILAPVETLRKNTDGATASAQDIRAAARAALKSLSRLFDTSQREHASASIFERARTILNKALSTPDKPVLRIKDFIDGSEGPFATAAFKTLHAEIFEPLFLKTLKSDPDSRREGIESALKELRKIEQRIECNLIASAALEFISRRPTPERIADYTKKLEAHLEGTDLQKTSPISHFAVDRVLGILHELGTNLSGSAGPEKSYAAAQLSLENLRDRVVGKNLSARMTTAERSLLSLDTVTGVLLEAGVTLERSEQISEMERMLRQRTERQKERGTQNLNFAIDTSIESPAVLRQMAEAIDSSGRIRVTVNAAAVYQRDLGTLEVPRSRARLSELAPWAKKNPAKIRITNPGVDGEAETYVRAILSIPVERAPEVPRSGLRRLYNWALVKLGRRAAVPEKSAELEKNYSQAA